jgi:hypothetical protein
MYIDNDLLKQVFRKVIIRALQDYQGRSVHGGESKPLMMQRAKQFLESEDCLFICETIGLNYQVLLAKRDIPLKLTKTSLGGGKKRVRAKIPKSKNKRTGEVLGVKLKG